MFHDYSFGIEEEYFLSSPVTGRLEPRAPKELLEQARTMLGDSVTAEFLQSQLEISSPIFRTVDEAASGMLRMRQQLAELVATKELQLIAASTHPLGSWREQAVTEKPRYDELMSDFRIVGQRNLVCGMHVHVAVPTGIDRVALMNRLMPWLPLFLALSTSSPFWNCRITGLMSYRQAVYDEWPRSGIPDFFEDETDYSRFVDAMATVGALKDASYLWWAIRPALKYPTLELRIADVCTSVEDGVALAALFRALVATFIARSKVGAMRTTHTRRLIDENRWRAKRDGLNARLIDEERCADFSVAEWVTRAIEMTAPEARKLNCMHSLDHIQTILSRGTSADAQLRIYNEQRAAGATRLEALREVVNRLSAVTVGGVW